MSDINELMARDPLSLSKDDIREIIEKFRSSRHLWANGITTKAPSKKAATKAPTGVDMGDIEL